jgi:hypothetical protein
MLNEGVVATPTVGDLPSDGTLCPVARNLDVPQLSRRKADCRVSSRQERSNRWMYVV